MEFIAHSHRMLLVTRGSERRGAVPRDILGKFRSKFTGTYCAMPWGDAEKIKHFSIILASLPITTRVMTFEMQSSEFLHVLADCRI